MKSHPVTIGTLLMLGMAGTAQAEKAASVTQYGTTWTFDKPYTVGRFVIGDYWVLGPVTVVSVSPAPQAAPEGARGTAVNSVYGTPAMRPNGRMRNGSMVVLESSTDQGYDSRLLGYNPDLSVTFPLKLEPNWSLISSISNPDAAVPVLLHDMMWQSEATDHLALKAAAVLTCLEAAPPADAFRPPYAGTRKPIYRTKDLKWNLLPKLAPVGPVPDWTQYERYLQRPWLDHIDTWLLQHLGPSENQTNYGREWSRMTSIASLMLMLDVPREHKEKLLIEFVQMGIDLHGLAQCGRQWPGYGGHWNGRKWPILFASMMLDDKRLQQFPVVKTFYDDGSCTINPAPGIAPSTTLFSEDMQTYYGKGGAGQTVLYDIIWHSMRRLPYEEKDPATYTPTERWIDGYRGTCSVGWPGTALAALMMKAKAQWNHDAFFDYCDRWMEHDINMRRRRTFDPWVEAMWAAYRKSVPDQPGGNLNLKWVWDDERTGHFAQNPSQGR